MGLVESKLMLQKLSHACEEAESQGSNQIEGILLDSYTTQYLQTVWTRIPEGTRQRLTGISKRKPATGRKRKRARKARITLSESVTNSLSCWTQNPSEFFSESDEHNPSEFFSQSDEQIDFGIHLVLFYRLMFCLERRRDNDLIRSRFLKVIFYTLKQGLGVERLHSHNLETITQIISTSGLVENKPETIQTNISEWCKQGKKIDSLCRDVYGKDGAGHRYLAVLFCLPEDVGKEYLRVLHEEGPDRMYKIQQLRERGILEVECMEELSDLADAIYKHVWKCFASPAPNTPHIFFALEDANCQNFDTRLPSSEEAPTQDEILLDASPIERPTQSPTHTSNSSPPCLLSQVNSDTFPLSQEGERDSERNRILSTDSRPLDVQCQSSQLPYDHWLYVHPMPQDESMASLQTNAEMQVSYDHWQYIHPMPQGESMASLPTNAEMQVPYDHWLYVHPMPQDESMASLPTENAEMQDSESISIPLRATYYSAGNSQPTQLSASSNLGNAFRPQAETYPPESTIGSIGDSYGSTDFHGGLGAQSSTQRLLNLPGQSLHSQMSAQAVGSA